MLTRFKRSVSRGAVRRFCDRVLGKKVGRRRLPEGALTADGTIAAYTGNFGQRSPDLSRDIRALDATVSSQPTEEVLAWAWERFGTRAAIGTSFQGAGLVMMHLAKAERVSLSRVHAGYRIALSGNASRSKSGSKIFSDSN